jgi:hypothetical protein
MKQFLTSLVFPIYWKSTLLKLLVLSLLFRLFRISLILLVLWSSTILEFLVPTERSLSLSLCFLKRFLSSREFLNLFSHIMMSFSKNDGGPPSTGCWDALSTDPFLAPTALYRRSEIHGRSNFENLSSLSIK